MVVRRRVMRAVATICVSTLSVADNRADERPNQLADQASDYSVAAARLAGWLAGWLVLIRQRAGVVC